MQESRKKYIDVAKAFGIIAIVLGHCSTIQGPASAFLYSFSIPIFFIICGLCFKPEENFKTFIIKKAKSYLIPYLFCSFVILLWDIISIYIFRNITWNDILTNLLKFLVQRRFTTLWFLAALLFGCVFFYLIFHYLKKDYIKYILSVTLGIGFILYNQFVKFPLPWNIDVSFVSLIFIAFGYHLKKQLIFEQFNVKKKLIVMFLSLVIGTTTFLINILCGFETLEMYSNSYGVFPITITCALSFSLFILLLSNFIENCIFLQFIGKNTLVIMAFHQSISKPISSLICEKLSINANGMPLDKFLYSLIYILSVAIVCSVIGFTIHIIKADFLLGKKQIQINRTTNV